MPEWECWAKALYERIQQVKDWGEWLGSEWEWDWWMTMTFREDVGVRGANSRWKAWARWLSTQLQCEACPRQGQYARCSRGEGVAYVLCRYRKKNPVYLEYARFQEFHRWRGDWPIPHYHALVILPEGQKDFRRDKAWASAFAISGRTLIEPYDPERGAAFYLTKYVVKGADVLFSPGLEAAKLSQGAGPGD